MLHPCSLELVCSAQRAVGNDPGFKGSVPRPKRTETKHQHILFRWLPCLCFLGGSCLPCLLQVSSISGVRPTALAYLVDPVYRVLK
jgi:hypothetical protein